MARYVYLTALIVALGCMGLIDRRWRLAFYDRPKAASATVGLAVLFFLMWDIAGIALGIFFTNQRFISGLHLGHPDLPIEELLLLSLIGYLSLILLKVLERRT